MYAGAVDAARGLYAALPSCRAVRAAPGAAPAELCMWQAGSNSRKKPDCRAGKHAVWLTGPLVDLKDARAMMSRIMMIMGDVSLDG